MGARVRDGSWMIASRPLVGSVSSGRAAESSAWVEAAGRAGELGLSVEGRVQLEVPRRVPAVCGGWCGARVPWVRRSGRESGES